MERTGTKREATISTLMVANIDDLNDLQEFINTARQDFLTPAHVLTDEVYFDATLRLELVRRPLSDGSCVYDIRPVVS